jgi:hypothetical protein
VCLCGGISVLYHAGCMGYRAKRRIRNSTLYSSNAFKSIMQPPLVTAGSALPPFHLSVSQCFSDRGYPGPILTAPSDPSTPTELRRVAASRTRFQTATRTYKAQIPADIRLQSGMVDAAWLRAVHAWLSGNNAVHAVYHLSVGVIAPLLLVDVHELLLGRSEVWCPLCASHVGWKEAVAPDIVYYR